MKKSIVGITAAIAVTAVVIIAAVPAAAWIREANHENQIQKVEAAVRETSTEPENNHTFRLEEPYFIEYEITDSEGNVSRIAKAEDAQGRIYYKDKEEYLFVPEGGAYLRYERKMAGVEETDGESFLCTRMDVGEIDLTIEDGEITAGNQL